MLSPHAAPPPPAASGTLGAPSPSRTGPTWSSSGDFWPTGPGLSTSVTGSRTPWPKRSLHLRPPPAGPGPGPVSTSPPCPSGEPAWDTVGAPSPSDEDLTPWAARMPSSPADWNPSSPGRPRALLPRMVTQTSRQNQGSSQPLSDSISLHLILSCPSCSSWAAVLSCRWAQC